jgi:hypothetical protein
VQPLLLPGIKSIALTDSAPGHKANMKNSADAMLPANKPSARLPSTTEIGRVFK